MVNSYYIQPYDAMVLSYISISIIIFIVFLIIIYYLLSKSGASQTNRLLVTFVFAILIVYYGYQYIKRKMTGGNYNESY
jgi:hypothetical protein